MFNRSKKYFFSGLAVFLPIVLTVYVSIQILNFAENIFGKHLRPFFIENYDFYFWGLGLITLVAVILFCGFVVTHYFGRVMHRSAEKLMLKIPLIANIYPAFKEIAQFVFKEDGDGQKPQQVVLIEWPQPGVFTIGFLTNNTPKVICQEAGQDLVNVLVPTVPNPITGFIAMVPRQKIRPLPITVEQAIKIIVSGGVVDPYIVSPDETAPKKS
ncbi:MAG: DUF502 domain-containing protein [Candidatus Omnitrophica bacterium]|nr:DUF502 domain-containing protein [Candidatus Omnitrophota bacterium]